MQSLAVEAQPRLPKLMRNPRSLQQKAMLLKSTQLGAQLAQPRLMLFVPRMMSLILEVQRVSNQVLETSQKVHEIALLSMRQLALHPVQPGQAEPLVMYPTLNPSAWLLLL